MQASRVSTRALKHLAAGSKQSTRNLSMTGPATYSNLITSERPAFNLPRDIGALRAECKKLKLSTNGSKSELIDRLSAHELAGTRAFSTAFQDSKRPASESTTSASTPTRHFNTSRSLKAVKDSSTIDFAYYPDFDPDTTIAPVIRVPILPTTVVTEASSRQAQAQAIEDEDPITLPKLFTAAADATHIYAPSFMSDFNFNETSNTHSINFQSMANKVTERFGGAATTTTNSANNKPDSMVRQVWTGLVEDVLGPKTQHA